MEWPSSRVDAFAGGTITLGFGFLYVTDPISAHHWRVAIAFWIVGIFIFICGFPIVRKKLCGVLSELVAFYKQVAILSPYAAPIGALTLTILMVALLFGGVWQSLSKSDLESAYKTQDHFSQQYVQVNKDGAIVGEENFDEYGMRVKRKDIEGKPRYSLGQTEYLLTFEKTPVRFRVETQEGLPVKVEPLDANTPNVSRVRCMQAGAGGSISVECNFTVEAFRK